MTFHLGVFGSEERFEELRNHASDAQYLGSSASLDVVKKFIGACSPQDQVVLADADKLWLSGDLELPEPGNADILFAASSRFRYDDESLRYYFWKYYPRGKTPYHYLDTSFVVGKATALTALFDQVGNEYPDGYSWHDLLTRFYVDYLLRAVDFDYHIQIDREQKLVGDAAGQTSAYRWPMLSWIHRDLFQRYEAEELKTSTSSRNKPLGVNYSMGQAKAANHITKSSPSIWTVPQEKDHRDGVIDHLSGRAKSKRIAVWLKSLMAYFKSLGAFLFAWIINRGVTSHYRIFRYAANGNPEWKRVMDLFLGHLSKREGFTFAHFNDGELTFIRKYLAGNHAETWFGRRQQKYSKRLGEQLTNALKLDMPRHYVGVPCGTSHPRLRRLADSLVEGQQNIVPAMSLHHNPRFFPNIINHMKDRECFFIKNEYQDLTIFEKLGVEIKKENQVIVPFKNSYLLFDELKDMKFPDGGIVILICGMLAKIIIPVWFENNPNTTFIALGSSMDDFIQRTNTKFTLFPKEGMPLTCNIQPTKYFAFGWKKECPECWKMEKDFDWPS